jgi:hypothetical protein
MPWDVDVYKINYGEPLYHDYEFHTADRLDFDSPTRYSKPLQWVVCVVSILIYYGTLKWFEVSLVILLR